MKIHCLSICLSVCSHLFQAITSYPRVDSDLSLLTIFPPALLDIAGYPAFGLFINPFAYLRYGEMPPNYKLKEYINFKRELRVILDSPQDSSSQPLFEELGWLTVFERVEYNKAILLYKSVNNMSPTYISYLFNFQNSEYYSLRSVENDNMAIPKHNTELFKNSFQYSGTKIWNGLPITLRTGFGEE